MSLVSRPPQFVTLLFLSILAVSGCSSAARIAEEPPASELRAFTGAHTRIVWAQGDGSPEAGEGNQLILMGLDSDDGKGERVILADRRSYMKPKLTARADRIVFSTHVIPGPSETFIVNWDGSGFRKLADGFALTLWQNPADGSDWVYLGTDSVKYDFRTVWRFPIDAPHKRELVWNTTLVSMEGFEVTPDGRQAGGMFPWPGAGMADLVKKTWQKLGEGCWTSLAEARGSLFWYFDGAHRNVTMVDVEAGTRWVVNLNGAPGFDGAEVSHPRWSNHPRFLSITGPYNQGGPNQSRTGGKQTEVYVGRFSEDFSTVAAWLRVTRNGGGDLDPDVWIDPAQTAYPRRPSGRIGPAQASAGRTAGAGARAAAAGRLVLNVRMVRPGTIPPPASILPYRNGLVVNEYEIMDVIQGAYGGKEIRIAQWAIRDGRVLPEARRTTGTAFTLTVDRYDTHPELEGERLLSDSENSKLPLYFDVTKR
jgi:hypothetical protein